MRIDTGRRFVHALDKSLESRNILRKIKTVYTKINYKTS